MGTVLKALILTGLLLLCHLRFPAQTTESPTDLKVKQLVEKKAEFHRLTRGQVNGYRINLHFGVDREKSKAIKVKFDSRFPEYATDEEYLQPNWVVMVGNFKTKLEAFAAFKKIKDEFPNAFIVNAKISVK